MSINIFYLPHVLFFEQREYFVAPRAFANRILKQIMDGVCQIHSILSHAGSVVHALNRDVGQDEEDDNSYCYILLVTSLLLLPLIIVYYLLSVMLITVMVLLLLLIKIIVTNNTNGTDDYNYH